MVTIQLFNPWQNVRRFIDMKFLFPLLFVVLLSDIAFCGERFLISIPDEKITRQLGRHDRISEYRVKISIGRVDGIMKIPEDWRIKTNDIESPQLEAWGFHGAGFLDLKDINQGVFKNFLTVEAYSDKKGLFDLKVFLTVEPFMEETPKQIIIEKKDIIITPMK
jgi:hypothetical protein